MPRLAPIKRPISFLNHLQPNIPSRPVPSQNTRILLEGCAMCLKRENGETLVSRPLARPFYTALVQFRQFLVLGSTGILICDSYGRYFPSSRRLAQIVDMICLRAVDLWPVNHRRPSQSRFYTSTQCYQNQSFDISKLYRKY